MTARQGVLEFDPTPTARRKTTARPLHVAIPPLTPDVATAQARQAIADAGLATQVSRVLTWPDDRPGRLFTVALLRVGADPVAVADALGALPGAEVWRGVAAVGVRRDA